MQNPFNSSISNIIWRDLQFVYSLIINEEEVTLIQQYTLNVTWKLHFSGPHLLSMTKHLNGKFAISITDQMYYNEINSYGLESILLIVDFNLDTNACISFGRIDGISFLKEVDVNTFLNPNISVKNMNSLPNIFYTNSLSLYEKNADPGNYTFRDITEYLWSRYFWNDFGTCHFNLPVFTLNDITSIPIGNNIKNSKAILVPFTQWQRSQFVFTAKDWITLNVPDCMAIDLTLKTIILDLTKITSVQTSFFMIFNAELIPFPNPDYTEFPHNYLTENYTSLIEFTNSIWTFISSNASNYLVINKITIFTLRFYDLEEDFINIKVVQNDNINSFSQSVSNNTSLINILLQANNISSEPSRLTIQYTDAYHKDNTFYKNITYDLYLFSSEPPIFNQELLQVNATRWTDYSIKLPSIFDPNDLKWIVSLINPPSWVSLSSNTLIYLNTSNIVYQIPETTKIIVRIINSMEAWTKYNLTINVQPISTPVFGQINDVILNKNATTILKIDYEGTSKVITSNWSNKKQISWILFNDTSHELIIEEKCINNGSLWVILMAYDSCSNEIYSNKFNLSLPIITPLCITNTFGPLTVFKGEKKLFVIPSDLFSSSNPHTLLLSANVLNCSTYSRITTKIFYSNEDDSQYLYVNSNSTNTWYLL